MPEIRMRDYQELAITGCGRSIASGNKRIILQSHVGSGKTVMAAEIIQRAIAKRNRVLFLAPRRQLIYQTVETLQSYDINCGMIMAGERRFTQPLVQVASFDTITARMGAGRMTLPEAELCIVDEAHMCTSPARIKILGEYKVVIGLTATPALANGKGLGFFYQDIVESLSMADMVKQGHLVPMRYFIGESPDLSGLTLNADGDFREADLERLNDTPKLIGDIYTNWRRIAPNRTTLIFAVNKKHARHLHDEFASHGVSVDYIDGETPPEERERIRQDVEKGKTQVIVNIGVMVAGVNWPRIDCVLIARQMRNIANWIQCIGRGSRLYPNKKDCIVIYHGSNFEELGMIDEPIEWDLNDKTTIRERKERAKQEAKEPKDIVCGDCGTVFQSRRTCPNCGHEMIKAGEPIPVHEAELKEITAKPKPLEKSHFYAQLLGYCKEHGKGDNYALAMFKQKFGEWPYGKKSIQPVEPGPEVLGYIKSRQIAYAKGRGKWAR